MPPRGRPAGFTEFPFHKMKCIRKLFLLATILVVAMTTVFADEPQFKIRAIWLDPPSFATPTNADEIIARCQRAGLNLILPNVMWNQTVYFKSSHFAGKIKADDAYDPLGYLVAKAHAAGIQVQAWCCVYYEGGRIKTTPPLHPAWLDRSLTGQPFEQNWISAGNPEVNPYLFSVMKDLLAYDIDGIHLDYIRYPCTAFDYSDAARAAFKCDKGFDPQNFLDHVERIIPPEQEKFPVRVLEPKSHSEAVWETTAIERTLDLAGIGFGFVSESPELIAQLRAPGLLIVSSYNNVPGEMLSALQNYVARGGNIIWTDVPAKAMAHSPALQKFLGVSSARRLGERRIALKPASDHPLAKFLNQTAFWDDSVFDTTPDSAKVISRFASGEPAVMLNEVGKGRVITLGFHLMKSTSPVVASLAKEMTGWFKAEAVAGTNDLLAAKRAEWIAWRSDRVTQLVRELSAAAKQKNPKLVISSSGGPSPFEFYACYRDARRWLAEGINDEIFPMNYTPDPVKLPEMLDLQAASAPAGTFNKIFPGLEIYIRRTGDTKVFADPMDASLVEQQLKIVQQQGCPGFCLYSSTFLTDATVEVVRKFNH